MKKLTFFNNRHTVRQYSSRQISDKDLLEMLQAASHAPNTGNMQWYSVVVTRDAEKKKALSPAHFNQPSVMQAAAVLTFCVDLNRFEKWCRISNAVPGFNNNQSFLAAVMDTTIFAQQFCTIAELNDLGTCYLGTTAYNAADIASVLELPDRVVPVISVTVGYPLIEGVASDRLPVESFVHFEKYNDAGDDEIRDAYKVFDEGPDASKFICENQKQTLAQVFTDVRYPRESSEYFSKKYYEFVTSRGFNSSGE